MKSYADLQINRNVLIDKRKADDLRVGKLRYAWEDYEWKEWLDVDAAIL